MVFMTREGGHPLGATLVLVSMVVFALVFQVVTRPAAPLAAQFNVSLAAFRVAAATPPPVISRATVSPPAAIAVSRVSVAVADGLVEKAAPTQPAAMPILDSIALPAAPIMMPSTVHALSPATPTREGGAVTRALATTRSAVRNALSRAF
jgi:hypothetical protein